MQKTRGSLSHTCRAFVHGMNRPKEFDKSGKALYAKFYLAQKKFFVGDWYKVTGPLRSICSLTSPVFKLGKQLRVVDLAGCGRSHL